MPCFALGDDELGVRDDEQRRADDGQSQAFLERCKVVHGGSSSVRGSYFAHRPVPRVTQGSGAQTEMLTHGAAEVRGGRPSRETQLGASRVHAKVVTPRPWPASSLGDQEPS